MKSELEKFVSQNAKELDTEIHIVMILLLVMVK